jgi:hypothetical protein
VATSLGRYGLTALAGIAIIAALALTTTAKAGLIGTGQASYCDPNPVQAFAAFGDSAFYATLPNGDFEDRSAGWVLSGGARVASGNEPFFVTGDTRDSHSLLLPEGSSAYSGTVCFALGDWHLRLFAKNVGSRTGGLRVQVVVPSLLGGLLTVLDGGTINGSGTWAPSPRLELMLCNVTSLLGTRSVAFRFTPVGNDAAYQLDDVYLDPWKGT